MRAWNSWTPLRKPWAARGPGRWERVTMNIRLLVLCGMLPRMVLAADKAPPVTPPPSPAATTPASPAAGPMPPVAHLRAAFPTTGMCSPVSTRRVDVPADIPTAEIALTMFDSRVRGESRGR